MSNDTSAEPNEFGPNYLGYYKHLLMELLCDKESNSPVMESAEPSMGHSKGDQGIYRQDSGKSKSYSGSVSFFTEGIGKGFPEYKKERLKSVLHETAVSLNQEADEMLGHILATFQIGSDQKEKLLSCYASGPDEDVPSPLCRKKRKASPSLLSNASEKFSSLPSFETIEQVYKDIHPIQDDGEISQAAVGTYSAKLLGKLCKMEQDLDEYVNEVVSHCRPMTHAEKQQLGSRIQKLPEKALDRVVEIFEVRNFPARQHSNNVFINLEEQDNVTLWRLYYYVETVLKANKR
ncbi:uncharacterized protein [Typha latifolia]|uniref:uncharacterized protein n=1 Tax=Typha latifolia TaxID=4733 RepID=UPI003C2FBD8E